jgi:protein TonB
MKYLVILSKLSFIFLLMMLHFGFVKQWLNYFSEQPVAIKLTTIPPVMIHFVATIPPAPLLPMAAPDKKSDVKTMSPKTEVKQREKLKKLPISSTQREKPLSSPKVQKTNAPVQKNPPAPLAKVKKPAVQSEKPVVAEKSVTAVKSTSPVVTKTEAKVVATSSSQVEKVAAPTSAILSTERATGSQGSSIAKNATLAPSSAGKTTGQATANVNQSQVYVPPNHRAAYLHNPKPHYPEISQQLEEQGTVQLLVHVDSRGQVSRAQIKHSCGYPRLDMAALQAVKQWQFIPAKQGDKAIAATTIVPIVFRLDEE